jgi:ferredoxin
MGNDGGWESMDFWPEVESLFIADYLGPTFEKRGLGDVAIYGFDQNIFEMEPYTRAIYGNPKAKDYAKNRRNYLISIDRAIPRERQPDHCIMCGHCTHTKHCPQNIKIPTELKRIADLIEQLKRDA